MANILAFLTPNNKRGRNSSTESDYTPARKKTPSNPEDYRQTIPDDLKSPSIMEDSMEEDDNTILKSLPNSTQEDPQPEWAKQLVDEVRAISLQQSKDSLTLNSININNCVMEAKLDEALSDLSASKKEIKSLSQKLACMSKENDVLKKKLLESDNYSRKNNLKFFGIPENTGESTRDLLQKLATVLHTMELNLANFSIDNIHRLPTNGKGPRPVIVKFCSNLDKQLILRNTVLLKNNYLNITVREHFALETENNIRILLPIRREALQCKLKVRMHADKLFINNQ